MRRSVTTASKPVFSSRSRAAAPPATCVVVNPASRSSAATSSAFFTSSSTTNTFRAGSLPATTLTVAALRDLAGAHLGGPRPAIDADADDAVGPEGGHSHAVEPADDPEVRVAAVAGHGLGLAVDDHEPAGVGFDVQVVGVGAAAHQERGDREEEEHREPHGLEAEHVAGTPVSGTGEAEASGSTFHCSEPAARMSSGLMTQQSSGKR